MKAHNFWHPVLRTKDIKHQPVSVNFCGKELVVFRGKNGILGALEDCCPHRRMRLSKGSVKGNRLVCPYHGWNYDRDGKGISPSTPILKPCVKSYDVAEKYGAIWVKEINSTAELPTIANPKLHQVCTLHYRIQAPLELLVDNFSEIEHSCTTHVFLGHDVEGIPLVESSLEVAEDAVRIINKGPQKKMPRLLELLLGYKRGSLFVGELEVLFSPVHINIKNYWIPSNNSEFRKGEAQGAVFFNPVNDQETEMMMFSFMSPELAVFSRFLNPVATFLLDYETKLDKKMLEGIANKNISLAGMQLGRFDKVLKLTRERIERLYWQKDVVSAR
ncbi:MAG: Rieske 2Fe-2S domain-containing protein [Calothrix sp. MO_167.B12]|nr:Rieske 2Fe-2S domain-containing protein [Calothrix sp. MO_167.B12]